ncbi:MAG TPA: hypothetical protein VKI23_05265, partial [Cellulomonadaceae bacterium]|nr:hypothetical protein [Cellulomonadaceae bacterium]
MAPRTQSGTSTSREVVLCGRADSLSDAALLSLLVAEGSDIAGHEILRRHPIPDGFWRVSAEDL